MKEYINKNETGFASLSAYMSSPTSSIQDFKNCYFYLIKFLEDINNDENYSKGYLQIEGAVEKFLKCAVNNGYDNNKVFSETISLSKDLSSYILKYNIESENFVDIVSFVFFKINNKKKILKINCKELFLQLFNKINIIYNEVSAEKELFSHHFDIFDFYKPSEIERHKSIEFLQKSISIIDGDTNLNTIEKNKIISRINLVEHEINGMNPCLSDVLGILNEIVIILKSIAIGLKENSSINEAKDEILNSISIIENSSINSKLIKIY